MSVPFAERLKNLRHALRLSQPAMAERLGISKDYVWQLESGAKKPGPRIAREVELMEKAPSVSPAVTARGDIMRDVPLTKPRYIPLVSWAHAGVSEAYEELPKSWQSWVATDVTDPHAVAIEVRGDSMEPQIREGYRVIIVPSQEPRNGDLVVVKFADDGVALKLYHERDGGRIVNLASYNTLYPPQDYRREDFQWIAPVEDVIIKVRH